MAWEFVVSMLQAQDYQGGTGRVPIQFNVWQPAANNETQPPLLAWVTWEIFQTTNNTAALAWAAPRLAAYLEYDFATRDSNNNSLLEWSTSFESGMDNSPIYDKVGPMCRGFLCARRLFRESNSFFRLIFPIATPYRVDAASSGRCR